jgi:serine protease Do
VRGEFARVYRLPDVRGAIVADVPVEGGTQPTPAVKAGLQTNDVIVEFNGQPVQDSNDLIAKVAGTAVGQTVTITFLRDLDGKLDRRTVSVTLAERQDLSQRDVEINGTRDRPEMAKTSSGRIGLTLAELTPQQITEKHLVGVKGLYVKEVDPNGLAADVRPNEIIAGEVVTRVNRIPVTTLTDFQRVIESLKPGDAIVLNLSRFDRSSNPNRIVQRIVQFTYQ